MVYNIDGTVNRGGTIKEEVTMVLKYQEHQERAVFEVCDLGKTNLIIGCLWLWKHNPEIDWKTGKVQMTRCPKECNVYGRKMKKEKRKKKEKECPRKYSVMMEEVEDEEMPNGEVPIMIEKEEQKQTFRAVHGGQSWDKNIVKVEKPVEEWVPKVYHEHLSVFQKKESERMPVRKPWDHAIEMKPGFVPKKSKVYPLSPMEQEEVDAFLKEQLRKGYI